MAKKSVKQLREERAAAIAEMKAIHEAAENEDRELTAEEQSEYDAFKAEADLLTNRIERQAEVDATLASLEKADPPKSRGAIERPQGPEAVREFESLGEFVAATRFRPNDQRLASLYHEPSPDPRGEQRMDDGASGGFLVPEQFRSTILQVEPTEAIFRPRANVIPAGSPPDSAISIPALDQTNGDAPESMYGGFSVSWIGEGGTKPESDVKFREIKLEPHEVAAHTVITDKLLRNWPAASAYLERNMRMAVIGAEERAFFKGDGVAKPKGIVDDNGAYVYNRETANTVTYDDITGMMARCLGMSKVWIATQALLPILMRMEDTEGHLIWTGDARSGAPTTLAGVPIMFTDRGKALGTKGDLVLADLSYYLIKDGSGPFVAASEHVHFTTNKTAVKIFWNVDGQGWLTAPLEGEDGYTRSPFVVLDVTAGSA